MKKLFTIIACILAGHVAYSQEPPDGTKNEKVAETIEALKVAYITKELELSAEEAQQFWPSYNSFSSEIKKARQEFKDDDIAFEEKRVGIMKKYRESFRKILNNEIMPTKPAPTAAAAAVSASSFLISAKLISC